ncbi:MAG: Fic family protein [Thermoplasmata archaeon]|nr:Fic family protein [Thermoplasmata archaeon]
MAVSAARFGHCHARRPVAYRSRSPFRPLVAAPLDFAVRAARVYTLDHELDRAVLNVEEYAGILLGDLERSPGPGGAFLSRSGLTGAGARSAAPVDRRRSPRERFAVNEARLEVESARFRPPWTVALLQDVHASLLSELGAPGTPGDLRTRPLVVNDPDGYEVFTACPPEQIVPDLESVLEWVDRVGATYHPLIPATVLFQSIHGIRPFPVGNVTVGRTVAILYLRLFGLPNVGLTALPRVAQTSRELTSRLLLWTEATGSYQELVDHALDTVLDAYSQANARWLGRPPAAGSLEEAALRLLARARRDPGWFSTRDAMRWVDARSEQTILRHLNDLVDRGLLESLGKTRGKRFRLAPPLSLEPTLSRTADAPELPPTDAATRPKRAEPAASRYRGPRSPDA